VFGVLAFAASWYVWSAPASAGYQGVRVTTVVKQESQRGSNESTPTTDSRQTTTESRPDPGVLDRLWSPRMIRLTQLGAALLAAFIIAALVQRVLVARYGFKLAGAELPELSDEPGPVVQANQFLAEATRERRHLLHVGRRADRPDEREKQSREPAAIVIERDYNIQSLDDLVDKVETQLRELLDPPAAVPTSTPEALLAVLVSRGVLDQPLADHLLMLLRWSRATSWLQRRIPSKWRKDAVRNGPTILRYLMQLRMTAAATLEEYILIQLVRLPAAYEVSVNVPLNEAVRTDARVTQGSRSVIVEVRARLAPNDFQSLRSTKEWLTELARWIEPDQLIIIIVPGRYLEAFELDQLRDIHPTIRIVSWDLEGDRILTIVQDSLLSRGRGER
jgi:hypothetical protein